jgi:hypothetical protein
MKKNLLRIFLKDSFKIIHFHPFPSPQLSGKDQSLLDRASLMAFFPISLKANCSYKEY